MLLKPAPSDAAIETEWHFKDNEEEYDVERILDSRRSGRKIEYLVKWLGYDNKENSREPTENFSPATNKKLRSFHRQNSQKPGSMETKAREKPKPPKRRSPPKAAGTPHA